jgi:hypothetical protein
MVSDWSSPLYEGSVRSTLSTSHCKSQVRNTFACVCVPPFMRISLPIFLDVLFTVSRFAFCGLFARLLTALSRAQGLKPWATQAQGRPSAAFSFVILLRVRNGLPVHLSIGNGVFSVSRSDEELFVRSIHPRWVHHQQGTSPRLQNREHDKGARW